MDKSHVHIIYLASSYHTAEAVATKSNGRNEVLVRGDGFAPLAFWSAGCHKAKSEPFRLRFALFAAVRSVDFPLFPTGPACFFRVLGQKWVRHNSVIENPIINIESVICAEGDYCINKSLIKYLLACSLS